MVDYNYGIIEKLEEKIGYSYTPNCEQKLAEFCRYDEVKMESIVSTEEELKELLAIRDQISRHRCVRSKSRRK